MMKLLNSRELAGIEKALSRVVETFFQDEITYCSAKKLSGIWEETEYTKFQMRCKLKEMDEKQEHPQQASGIGDASRYEVMFYVPAMETEIEASGIFEISGKKYHIESIVPEIILDTETVILKVRIRHDE